MQAFVVAGLLCSVLSLLTSCSSSIPENHPAQITKVTLQPIYPPKSDPGSIQICANKGDPDRPNIEISPVSTRAWSLEEGIHNLREKAALLGADAIIHVRHKTQFNVEHSRNIYFVYGEAILWKHGRNSEYLANGDPGCVLPVD